MVLLLLMLLVLGGGDDLICSLNNLDFFIELLSELQSHIQ